MLIEHLPYKFKVGPAVAELEANPDLWNQNRARTEAPDSPHRETDDIWLRYADKRDDWGKRHESFWYPSADRLPYTRSLCYRMMEYVDGDYLGGVLITRIPPGKQVYPHLDEGWHARRYEKFAVQLVGDLDQTFCYEDEFLVTQSGDSFTFNNQSKHWVVNNSSKERITLIICIWRGASCLLK